MDLLKNIFKGDKVIWIIFLCLCLISIIEVFSAASTLTYKSGDHWGPITQHSIILMVGAVVVVLMHNIPYKWFQVFPVFLYPVSVVLLAFVTLMGVITGDRVNGAARWMSFMGLQFQPSELAKVAIVMTFATLMSTYREKMQTFRYGVLPFAVILLVICGLVALEKHFSCILILLTIGASMMFLGGTELKWFGIGAAVVAVFAVLYLNFMGYASARVTAWRDPASDPAGDGYQILQSLYAIGSGGLMGLGLGRSRQKYLYLPEEHNDYIFPILCEELGFVGALVVLVLFMLLIIRGYWIAMHARDRFGALMAAGLTTHLALQVFLNIGVVTNFLPATGISLPFFSYGGTALLIQLFEVGLILSISRQNDNKLL